MSLSLLGTDKQITLAADPLCLLRCKVKVKVLSAAEGEGTDGLRADQCVHVSVQLKENHTQGIYSYL